MSYIGRQTSYNYLLEKGVFPVTDKSRKEVDNFSAQLRDLKKLKNDTDETKDKHSKKELETKLIESKVLPDNAFANG
jgi:hypothetical protein